MMFLVTFVRRTSSFIQFGLVWFGMVSVRQLKKKMVSKNHSLYHSSMSKFCVRKSDSPCLLTHTNINRVFANQKHQTIERTIDERKKCRAHTKRKFNIQIKWEVNESLCSKEFFLLDVIALFSLRVRPFNSPLRNLFRLPHEVMNGMKHHQHHRCKSL